jgi:hypothetical protein
LLLYSLLNELLFIISPKSGVPLNSALDVMILMSIFRNIFFLIVITLLCGQTSFLSGESISIKKESFNEGYGDAVHDIEKGNWRYTIIGLTSFKRIFEIQKAAENYGLKVRVKDSFRGDELPYTVGYNSAVRDKLKEKYGFDVIRKITEK